MWLGVNASKKPQVAKETRGPKSHPPSKSTRLKLRSLGASPSLHSGIGYHAPPIQVLAGNQVAGIPDVLSWGPQKALLAKTISFSSIWVFRPDGERISRALQDSATEESQRELLPSFGPRARDQGF